MSAIKLSPEQAAVEDAVHGGYNVLATGPAGSGKSTLLTRLRERYGSRLSVTASTGIAALNVGGTTINSFAGLGKGEASAQEISDMILGSKRRVYRNITECELLAIDEISMISGELFQTIDRVFKNVRRNECPFGGVQLVMFGDFLQLPPVSKAESPATFAFESRAWAEAEPRVHCFSKVFRQADQPFADALSRLRVGDVNHPSIGLIAKRNNIPLPDDGIRPVVIHMMNADVDRANLIELEKINAPEFSFPAIDTGRPDARERLDRDCLAPKVLRLRAGAQVMLLANLDVEAGLVNGSLGVVTDLKQTEIRVRFGRTVVSMEHRSWEIQNNGQVSASRTQYPLRLAYSVTAHKTQGLTLDRIECHLDPQKTFEYGQAYVAVSRVKTLEGLFLRRSTRHAFRAHPKALDFYARSAAADARVAA